MGNASNPMMNITFDNVTMSVSWNTFWYHGRLPFHEPSFPYSGKYQCENAFVTCKNCHPTLDCFDNDGKITIV
jgi:hypothetical protein